MMRQDRSAKALLQMIGWLRMRMISAVSRACSSWRSTFNSTQAPNEVVPTFTRARYQLVRVAGTTPLLHRPEELDFGDLVSLAFGDN